ncbi:hypothetical protein F5X99DRAFT_411848 [Biscogniauxia marginata]|nr:hypothetical protein F5X99DRAFT_411848 [Biscogniauxia marginata]
MPTYLCHGFRWHRRSIRLFILVRDIEDAAPDWVLAPRCSAALIEQLYELFDFLPTRALPQPRSKSPPAQSNSHKHTLSKGSSSHSRANSSDNRVSEERGGVGVKDRTTGGTGASRKRSLSSLRRPKTSARDETPPPVPPLPPTPLTSPPLLEDDENGYFNAASAVQLLEEHDPRDVSRVSSPWAYVADYAVRIDTSVSIVEEMNRYEAQMKAESHKAMSGSSDETGRNVNTAGSKKAGWLERLRDELQRGESIRWYVVVCGDEERDPDPTPYAEDGEEYEASSSARSQEPGRPRQSQSTQSTGRSVFENGFEFRIPELAGLAEPRPPTAKPDRRRAKTLPQPLPPPLPEKDYPVIPPPPHPIQVAGKMTADNYARPKTPRASGGIRKLFSRRSTEGSR